MTTLRIALSLLACVACFGTAFVVTKYRQSWVLLGGAFFWVLGGNIARAHFDDAWGDHWFRWSPFYVLAIAAACAAVTETIYRKCRKGK